MLGSRQRSNLKSQAVRGGNPQESYFRSIFWRIGWLCPRSRRIENLISLSGFNILCRTTEWFLSDPSADTSVQLAFSLWSCQACARRLKCTAPTHRISQGVPAQWSYFHFKTKLTALAILSASESLRYLSWLAWLVMADLLKEQYYTKWGVAIYRHLSSYL